MDLLFIYIPFDYYYVLGGYYTYPRGIDITNYYLRGTLITVISHQQSFEGGSHVKNKVVLQQRHMPSKPKILPVVLQLTFLGGD